MAHVRAPKAKTNLPPRRFFIAWCNCGTLFTSDRLKPVVQKVRFVNGDSVHKDRCPTCGAEVIVAKYDIDDWGPIDRLRKRTGLKGDDA